MVWIAQHFGYRPSENRKTPTPTENWYNSLLLDNARKVGIFSQYADLDGIPFTLPALLTAEVLLSELILIFGNKFSKENAKKQLANFLQRGLTIGEYNSQFSSLVCLVEDVEADRIEKYVDGLNPSIIQKAMSKEWCLADTLEKRWSWHQRQPRKSIFWRLSPRSRLPLTFTLHCPPIVTRVCSPFALLNRLWSLILTQWRLRRQRHVQVLRLTLCLTLLGQSVEQRSFVSDA